MSNFKYITAVAFSLFSMSGLADLKSGLTTLNAQESTVVLVSFEEPIEGDLYVAAVKDGNIWFFKSNRTWVNRSGLEPVAKNQLFTEDLELFTVSAQQVSPGTYTLFQVITKTGGDPFNSNNWLPTKDNLNSLVLNINLAENATEFQDVAEPGSSRFGFQPNTDNLDLYFKPKLSQRALGDYTDVVNSKFAWDQLSSEKQKRSLFWDQDKLLGLSQEKLTAFDDLQQNSFVPSSKIKLTITEPLSSGNITAYPGCVGLTDLNANPRLCGEFNPKAFIASEIFSQRWTRLNNLDVFNNPLYADIEDKSQIKYELSVQVGTENIMSIVDQANISLAFEMSVSKVPGDFSENACKSNKAIQYSSVLTVRLTQVGLSSLDPNLPEVCKVNSDELQHYYVNVRAVNIDEENNEINESLCSSSTGCKFEIVSFLDSP